MRRVTLQGGTKLGITFLISLAISVWSANSGMKAMFDALNIVFDEKEKRGFFRLNAVSLAFTLLGIAFLLFALRYSSHSLCTCIIQMSGTMIAATATMINRISSADCSSQAIPGTPSPNTTPTKQTLHAP